MANLQSKNAAYWQKRFKAIENQANLTGANSLSYVAKQYEEASKELEKQISTWYMRFAKNNNITLAEAQQVLSGKALSEFKWNVHEYIQYAEDNALNGMWTTQLENASAKVHITKLEALKLQNQAVIEKLYGKQYISLSGALKDIFQNSYYHSCYEVQKAFGVGWNIAAIDENKLKAVLSTPWTTDGLTFSENLWKQRDKLIGQVQTTLTQGIMTGKSPDKMIAEIQKATGNSKANAGRLVMTESAAMSAMAQKDAFGSLGVEEFEIVETLDSKTCSICASLDGKHFPMSDYQVGVTVPPFHPHCRGCTCPWFDDDEFTTGERIARAADGTQYYVPENTTYQQWQDAFVNGDKSGFDVVSNSKSGLTSYKNPVPQEEVKPKKEYLTKKKLQAKIAEADVLLEDLDNKFSGITGGWTYDEVLKDYGSLNDAYSGATGSDLDDLAKLKDLETQILDLKQQKAEWEQKLNEKLIVEQKKALAKQQLDLEAQKALIQQQLDDFEIKTYSGIWYNKDVTTADWSGLNIAGKKQYYENKFITETDPDLLQKYQDLYKQLEELDTEGKAYADVQKQLSDIQKQIAQVQSDLKKVEKGDIIDVVDDAYTQTRKDAALWAKSTKEADDALRDKCGEVWRNSPPIQKNAIYEYTSSYSKFNEPLRGIEYGTNAVKGVGNLDFDTIGMNYGGFKRGEVRKQINAMTDIIEKSTYDFDIWLQRGCEYRGMDNFFEISLSDLQYATQAELEKLLMGKTVTDYGFFSCGVSKGKGFSHKPIIMNVYAPKGTKMMYAEPFSAFGNGGGKHWDGVVKQATFGNESEIILQQGTSFRVTKVERTNGKLYIDIEVIIQNTPQR